MASPARAQSIELIEAIEPGDCWDVELAMTLSGEMRLTKNGKPVPLKLSAQASHQFQERALTVGAGGKPQRMARHYSTAQATIAVGLDRSERTLRPDRRLIVAQHQNGQALCFSPAGPLTRTEMELTTEHFDTLALPGLLPNKTVTVGDAWKVANETVQYLCYFEGLTHQDLTCKLEELTERAARISIKGPAKGIELGALVKLSIDATCEFDREKKRIVAVEWKQTDDREQGPASPATAVEMTSRIKRQPAVQSAALSDLALVAVPDGFDLPAAMTNLLYEHGGKPGYRLTYSRDWTQVGQTADHTVFRLMERGDFVAQATVTPWEAARPGQHLTPVQFREAMAKSPGWQQDEVVQEGEVRGANGYWVYRISAPGVMDGMNVVQTFYLVAGPNGEQVVVTFTMTPAQAEKLGNRDMEFVLGLTLPANGIASR
jgi:hypothetical protein